MAEFSPVHVIDTFGIRGDRKGEYLSVVCPFHADNAPSGRINLNTGHYQCFGCQISTNVILFVSKKLNKTLREVYSELGSEANREAIRGTYSLDDVEANHKNLFGYEGYLNALHYRCITDELIRYYRLGAFTWGDGSSSIVIPIPGITGEIIAVKQYNPGASAKKYGWPSFACNNIRLQDNKDRKRCVSLLYPVEQLAYDTILICGGELKAIAAASVLNALKEPIGAISATGSETIGWTADQYSKFAGKHVYVCFDVDKAGKDGADDICKALRHYAQSLKVCTLPLDVKEYPHGDINDFLRIGGDLKEVIDNAITWKSREEKEEEKLNEEPIDTDLDRAVSATLAKRRVKLKVVVSSVDIAPYPIPKEIHIKCTRDHTYCSNCDIFHRFKEREVNVRIHAEDIALIEMIGQELRKQDLILRKAFGIPARCSTVIFDPIAFFNVEDARVSQQLDISSRSNERTMQTAYCIGDTRLELNETYEMIGRMYPHPANQQAALLISKYTPTENALSTYKTQDAKALELFMPDEWTVRGITNKLNHIYEDLEANVTHIFARRDFHLAVDLAYHSPLFLKFDGKDKVKGWVEVLVIGDSAQGKSETINNLLLHYRLGERVVCKGATAAGLLGGVQQYGKRWFASWGKIPSNDRRLVILEELKGTSTEVISKLTDMRSSGEATLTKIEKRKCWARTRLIAISNPRGDKNLSTYNYGIDAVRELIGNPEDVRRFDLAILLERNEVNIEEVQRYRPIVPHIYTGDLCRELILFAWTVENVVFENELDVLEASALLCKMYSDDTPIVDRGSMKDKVARLAAALAVRTFSVVDDAVIVRKCHIDYIVEYLNRIYSVPAFGYKEYSKVAFNADKLVSEEKVRVIILKHTPYPKEFISELLCTDEIDLQFVQDTLGWPRMEASSLLSSLIRLRALKRTGRTYRKTTGFTQLLKVMEEEDGDSRPAYVAEEY